MEEIEEARLTVSLGKLAPFQLQFGFKHTRVTLNIEHLQLLQLTMDEKSHSTPQYDLSKSLNNRIYADFLFDWKMRKTHSVHLLVCEYLAQLPIVPIHLTITEVCQNMVLTHWICDHNY